MQVILLKNSRFGKKYEVKEVAPGLARNILLPRGEAMLATPENLKKAAAARAALLAAAANEDKLAEAIAAKLSGQTVELPAKAGPEGQLFSKINAKEVAQTLKQRGIELAPAAIELSAPIKHLGLHQVKARLGGGRDVQFTVLVTAL